MKQYRLLVYLSEYMSIASQEDKDTCVSATLHVVLLTDEHRSLSDILRLLGKKWMASCKTIF